MPDLIKLYPAQSESCQGSSPAGSWLIKLPVPVPADRLAELNADLMIGRPSRLRRVMLAAARFTAIFCIGVAATLAWQPYGDAAIEMIVNSSQQLGRLAQQAGPGTIFFPSAGPRQHDTAADLDAVRERIDRIASSQDQVTRTVAELTSGQGQIAQEITKIREIEQYLLYKTSYNEVEHKAADAVPIPVPAPHKPPRRPPLTIAQH